MFIIMAKSATLIRAPPSLVTTKTFMVNKVITLTQLLELVHQKINIESHQHIQHFRFWFLIFEPGQPYMYTYFILGDDPDIQQMFNSFYNNPTLPFRSYLPQFATTITHQTTNMTQPPMLRTYYMNTRVVGSKTMVVIVTPLPGRKDETRLLSTNQYSNEVGNLGIIHVLILSVLTFSRGVVCRCLIL